MCIIISTLQIIEPNLFVVVVTTISEGVDSCNIYVLGKLGVGNCTCDSTPRIVGVFCNSFCVLINVCDYVALQILDEVVGNTVIYNSAYSLSLSVICIYIVSFYIKKVNKKEKKLLFMEIISIIEEKILLFLCFMCIIWLK